MKVAIDKEVLERVMQHLLYSILPSGEVQQLVKALSQTEPIEEKEN